MMCLRGNQRYPTASPSSYVTVCNRRQLAPTVDGYITRVTVTLLLTVSERVLMSEASEHTAGVHSYFSNATSGHDFSSLRGDTLTENWLCNRYTGYVTAY